jgi:hypothetical protein
MPKKALVQKNALLYRVAGSTRNEIFKKHFNSGGIKESVESAKRWKSFIV